MNIVGNGAELNPHEQRLLGCGAERTVRELGRLCSVLIDDLQKKQAALGKQALYDPFSILLNSTTRMTNQRRLNRLADIAAPVMVYELEEDLNIPHEPADSEL